VQPPQIHPTAVIDVRARLGSGAVVGPHCVIDGEVDLGANCRLGPGVYLTGRTSIDEGNVFHAGCVIGDAPQDLKYAGASTGLRIGKGNVFREHVTVHRSNRLEEDTVIGAGGLFMAGSHVGHNAVVGDKVILANGALVGGHAVLGDAVFLSGSCLVHQFVRLGRLALMQGGAAISKDLPPFTIATGANRMCGLNVVGLRRAGVAADARRELKRMYHLLFRGEGLWRERLETAQTSFAAAECLELLAFAESSRRGICADRGAAGAKDADD